MNEVEIIQALDNACGDSSLNFQIIQQDPYLYIYINREAESEPDYTTLTETIVSTIAALEIRDLEGLWILSRVLGTVDPDWETFVELSPQMEPLEQATETNEAEQESTLVETPGTNDRSTETVETENNNTEVSPSEESPLTSQETTQTSEPEDQKH